jgi:hypothetical protein
VGGGHPAAELRGAFIHPLIPIAVVSALAHCLTLLVFQGTGGGAGLRPARAGLGPVRHRGRRDRLRRHRAEPGLYVQVGFVVAGHVRALALARDRALTLYDDARLAVCSQSWMVLVMIGFNALQPPNLDPQATLALWLFETTGV